MGISTYTNTALPFIASIVIGTIQLGATIDYAILITTKYINYRKEGKDKKEAIKEFADTLIYKLDHLKSIKINLGFDTTALTFRKEVLLDLISVTKIEQCSQADKLKTNTDRICSLSDEELGKGNDKTLNKNTDDYER